MQSVTSFTHIIQILKFPFFSLSVLCALLFDLLLVVILLLSVCKVNSISAIVVLRFSQTFYQIYCVRVCVFFQFSLFRSTFFQWLSLWHSGTHLWHSFCYPLIASSSESNFFVCVRIYARDKNNNDSDKMYGEWGEI